MMSERVRDGGDEIQRETWTESSQTVERLERADGKNRMIFLHTQTFLRRKELNGGIKVTAMFFLMKGGDQRCDVGS